MMLASHTCIRFSSLTLQTLSSSSTAVEYVGFINNQLKAFHRYVAKNASHALRGGGGGVLNACVGTGDLEDSA